MTGMLGEQATIAGRQADMDTIGAILAAQEVGGERMGRFGGVLASTLESMTPYQRRELASSLGVKALTPEQTAEAEEKRRVQTERLDALAFTPQEKDMFFNNNMTVPEIMALRDTGAPRGEGGEVTDLSDDDLVAQHGFSPEEIGWYRDGLSIYAIKQMR
jgi:hypothetical protein